MIKVTFKFLAFMVVAAIYMVILLPYSLFKALHDKLRALLVKMVPNEDTMSKRGTI